MSPFDWGLLIGGGVIGVVVLIGAGVVVYRIAKEAVDAWNKTH